MQVTLTPEQVQEWMAHPVTQLHRKRLEMERQSLVSDGALRHVVTDSGTVEAVGMLAIAHVNRAAGIADAYDHDDMYQFIAEVIGND